MRTPNSSLALWRWSAAWVLACCSCQPTTCPTRQCVPTPRPPSVERARRTEALRIPERLTDPRTREVLLSAGIDPSAINCNAAVIWIAGLDAYARRAAEELAKRWKVPLGPARRAEGTRVVAGHVVRMLFEQVRTQNLGVIRLKNRFYYDQQGKKQPLLVFRSGVTTDAAAPNSCLRSLIRHGHVRHVVNLYTGDFPLHDFIRKEQEIAQQMGATHHDISHDGGRASRWRSLIRSPKGYRQHREWAMREVATFVRDQVLQPDGKPPRGNVYFHCGGGMHRSGMISGILRRCINGDSIKLIEQEYKRHTAYRSPEQPGGYEALNMRFIREFDCSLLHQ